MAASPPAPVRPRVDIYESGQGLTLVADVPGARADALDISLERRELTIHAGVEENPPDGMSPLYREYQVGDYERRFPLAGDVDADKIDASLNNGVSS